MSKSSEYVKKWRKKIKEITIDAMGGGCQICTYNKCNKALELHHVNEKEKDFSFGYLMASCRNWKVIYEELSKCILLCANCHREVHANMVVIPINYQHFDSTIADSYRTEASLRGERTKDTTKDNALISQKRRQTIQNKIRLKKKHIKIKYSTKLREKNSRIRRILDSGVDFKKHGWVKKISEIIGISHQKVGQWMKNNMVDFYEKECLVRKKKVYKL